MGALALRCSSRSSLVVYHLGAPRLPRESERNESEKNSGGKQHVCVFVVVSTTSLVGSVSLSTCWMEWAYVSDSQRRSSPNNHDKTSLHTHTLSNNTATKINNITATFRNNERISGAFHLLPVSFPSPRAPGRSWHRAGQATVPCFLVPKQRARMSGGQLAASVVDEVVSRV